MIKSNYGTNGYKVVDRFLYDTNNYVIPPELITKWNLNTSTNYYVAACNESSLIVEFYKNGSFGSGTSTSSSELLTQINTLNENISSILIRLDELEGEVSIPVEGSGSNGNYGSGNVDLTEIIERLEALENIQCGPGYEKTSASTCQLVEVSIPPKN
jgi:hypothetical protein